MSMKNIRSGHLDSRSAKYKTACDQCHASKVKCPGDAPCKRCVGHSQPCHYSLARRMGKPAGSKNRKTLEKFRQGKEDDLQSINNRPSDTSTSSEFQTPNSETEGENTMQDLLQEVEDSDSRFMDCSTSSSPNFTDPLAFFQPFPVDTHVMLDKNLELNFDGKNTSILCPTESQFPGLDLLESPTSRGMLSADLSQNYCAVSIRSHSIHTCMTIR